MNMIYLVGKSPLRSIEPEELLNIVTIQNRNKLEVGILFLSDSVVGVTSKPFVEKLKKIADAGVKLYALKPDLDARGIKNTPDFVKQVGYDGFVDLVADKYEKIYSWM